MARVAKFIRRWTRRTAGFAFWIHAVLIFGIPLSSLETASHRIGLNVAEMLLGLFFLTMALLNGYGFWKFLLDLTYIYFFPFIFIYKSGVIAVKIASRFPKYAARFFPGVRPTFTWKAVLRELVADETAFATITSPTSVPATVQQAAPAVVNSSVPNKHKLWQRLLLPLRSFTIAWCILITATNKPLIAFFGLVVLVVHLARFIVNLTRVLARAQQFLRDAERKTINYATNLLNTVMNAPDEVLANQDVVRAVSLLALFRACAFLIINRVEVSYLFFLAACLVYIGVYIRIGILFGFLYLGIAKLDHLSLGFLDSMVNSFAMPFSYTNYPKHWLIQLCEYIHSLIVIGLGAGAAFAYVRQKVEGFRGIVEDVWEKLDQADVRSRMSYAAKKAKPAKKTSDAQMAPG